MQEVAKVLEKAVVPSTKKAEDGKVAAQTAARERWEEIAGSAQADELVKNKRAGIVALYKAACEFLGVKPTEPNEMAFKLVARVAIPVGIVTKKRGDGTGENLKGEIRSEGAVGYASFVKLAFKSDAGPKGGNARQLLQSVQPAAVMNAAYKSVWTWAPKFGFQSTVKMPVAKDPEPPKESVKDEKKEAPKAK
jgi:hypothetical protein